MITHRITRALFDGTRTLSAIEDVSAGQSIEIDESFPIAANTPFAFAFLKAKLKSIFMLSDVAVTIYTNDLSSGSPQDTIALAAGVPKIWTTSDAPFIPNPFAGNVTAGYCTNAASGAAQVQIEAIIDPT